MAESNLIERQRDLVRSFREATDNRTKEESNARNQHTGLMATADEALSEQEKQFSDLETSAEDVRQKSADVAQRRYKTSESSIEEHWRRVDSNVSRVRRALKPVSMLDLLEESPDDEVSEISPEDDAKELLATTVSEATELSSQIVETIRQLEELNDLRSYQKKVVFTLIIIAILIGILWIPRACANRASTDSEQSAQGIVSHSAFSRPIVQDKSEQTETQAVLAWVLQSTNDRYAQPVIDPHVYCGHHTWCAFQMISS